MRLNRESLTIPKDFAEIIKNCTTPECFITLGPKRLMLFPLGSWRQYRDILKASDNVKARRLLHRQRIYGSKLTEIDASGRIKLPHLLYSFLKEPEEVYITGARDHLEIYTVEEYENRLYDIDEIDPILPEDIL
jgi:DNA-binding transcriptional regulator/RsmH inhibitor MraZ